MTISPIWGRVPSKRTKTKFGMRGRVADVIICFKFYRNWMRGFRAVRGQKWGSSIDFDRRPYNRAALPCCLWYWNRSNSAADNSIVFKFGAGFHNVTGDTLQMFKVKGQRSRSRGQRSRWERKVMYQQQKRYNTAMYRFSDFTLGMAS